MIGMAEGGERAALYLGIGIDHRLISLLAAKIVIATPA
jgi:hypothetical protein